MSDTDTPALALTPDLAAWLTARQRAKEKVRHWQDAVDTAQRHITAALEAAGVELATLDGRPACKWSTVTQERIDGRRLKAERPDIAAEYIRTVEQQRFTVAPPRGRGGP